MKIAATLVLVCAVASASTRGSRSSRRARHRVLSRLDNGKPSFLSGDLGSVGLTLTQGLVSDPSAFTDSVTSTLTSILEDHVGFDPSRQEVEVVKTAKTKSGDYHIRVTGSIDGIPVDAASMMMHVHKDGSVFALNGELITTSDLELNETAVELSCDEALALALANSITYRGIGENGHWISDCELAYVHAKDGIIHKAWKRSYEYTHPKEENRYGVDDLYASVKTGALVEFIPQIKGGLSLSTKSCNFTNTCDILISTSSGNISTADAAANAAHNNAVATYNFFKIMFGRDSLDNAGMTLRSHVHLGVNYNNAYWNGYGMYYGAGDGKSGEIREQKSRMSHFLLTFSCPRHRRHVQELRPGRRCCRT
jgi:bacillolysin